MEFDDILILSAIFEVIVLICFFVLCSNVSALKQRFVTKRPKTAQFAFFMSLGDKERAREVLYRMIAEDENFNNVFYSRKQKREQCLKYFIGMYKSYFDALGIELNTEFLDKFLENKV